MRRLLCFFLSFSLLLVLSSCAGKDQKTTSENTDTTTRQIQTTQKDPSAIDSSQTEATATFSSSVQSSTSTVNTGTEELLQSASVDLDADGKNEEVEVLQKEIVDEADLNLTELEGILRIDGKNGRNDTTFIKKTKGMTGVMSSMEFKDLDGDKVKDVFIVIPDSGAAFAINYYYIYNYANGKSYKFNFDAAQNDFAGGFNFIYKGKGILQMKNDSYNFSADFDITNTPNGNGPDDENNKEYERAWVDPTPVVINENSKIALKSTAGGGTEIKVPIPVFGLATADMIGEIDMYFTVGEDFTPVMKRFEAMDFYDNMSLKKIGEWKKP